MSGGDLLWRPSPKFADGTNLARYEQWLTRRHGLSFDGYEDLWRWSTENLEAFWASIWEHFEVVADQPYEKVLGGREMPGAEWFPGARLNYVENLFSKHDPAAVAILHASESRPLTEITWAELRRDVSAAAAGLRRLGVGPSLRVVAYLPNIYEAVVAFLATASRGAIWASCSPDFGSGTVIDRFAQIEPKVLLAVDGYRYGGREFDRRAVVNELQKAIPSLEATVMLPYLTAEPDLGGFEDVIDWADLIEVEPAALEFEAVPFDHPLWVLYSSGTTGLPKAIVQSHGGILLEHLKTHHLHLDLREGDRYMWFTTTGWMMWNFLVSGLLTRSAIVLFDGNPGYPDMSRMWETCAEAKVTCFGTSAAFIAACMKDGVRPAEGRDLSALRAIGSTGSPLSPEGFDWIYEQLGADTWLFSASGGTDTCTAFVGGVPTLPVYRGELQGRGLGVRLESFDDDGKAVTGEVGELVITEPMPSMPVYFWNDEDGSRYRESYFEMFPGVWRHGDWIEITDRGTAIIYGRSDSTINRGGIRMGSSEIYRAVMDLPEVVDALVVDLPRPGTEGWMPLFVVLRDGVELSDDLSAAVARRIRERCSPRHVPDRLFEIDEVPRTLTGKVLEVPVKRILMGLDPERAVSRDALANPQALDYFVSLADQLDHV